MPLANLDSRARVPEELLAQWSSDDAFVEDGLLDGVTPQFMPPFRWLLFWGGPDQYTAGMTNVITRIATPPAWYPDPADSTQLRYWDGLGWTSHLSPNPAFARPVVAAVAPQGQTAASPDMSDFFYEPMISATRPTFQPIATAPRVSTSTLAGWTYALVPLLAVPFLLNGTDLDSGNTWSIAGAALLGLMVIALGLFAGIDHSQLRRRGVLNAPSGLVGVLPFVFAIGRAARVGRSGAAIVVASLVVQAAVVALVVWRVLPILT